MSCSPTTGLTQHKTCFIFSLAGDWFFLWSDLYLLRNKRPSYNKNYTWSKQENCLIFGRFWIFDHHFFFRENYLSAWKSVYGMNWFVLILFFFLFISFSHVFFFYCNTLDGKIATLHSLTAWWLWLLQGPGDEFNKNSSFKFEGMGEEIMLHPPTPPPPPSSYPLLLQGFQTFRLFVCLFVVVFYLE